MDLRRAVWPLRSAEGSFVMYCQFRMVRIKRSLRDSTHIWIQEFLWK